MMTNLRNRCDHSEAQLRLKTENLIDKKDARILWNVHPKDHTYAGKLKEVAIGYFPAGKSDEWPTELHDRFRFDYGNGNAEWPDVTFWHVMAKLSSYGFPHISEGHPVMIELSRIKEFRDEVAHALCFNCTMAY